MIRDMVREIVWRFCEPPQEATYTSEESEIQSLNNGGIEESVEEAMVCSSPASVRHKSEGPASTHPGESLLALRRAEEQKAYSSIDMVPCV